MILMIDDEERWVSGYQDAIIKSGYGCELISNVDELGTLLEDKEKLDQIELIILDIMMAHGKRYKEEDTQDGLNTGHFVLADLRISLPHVPIIILTNKDRDISGEIKALGCDRYFLKKDTDPSFLVSQIKTLLMGSNA